MTAARSKSPPVLIIVEPNPDDFLLLKRALCKKESATGVWWAQSALEAISLLDELEHSVSGICIVSDVPLPGRSGFELFNEIKARNSFTPLKFVLLTALCDPKIKNYIESLGLDGFFDKKSSRLTEVAVALQKLLAGMES